MSAFYELRKKNLKNGGGQQSGETCNRNCKYGKTGNNGIYVIFFSVFPATYEFRDKYVNRDESSYRDEKQVRYAECGVIDVEFIPCGDSWHRSCTNFGIIFFLHISLHIVAKNVSL